MLAANVFGFATSVDQDQPVHPCSLFLICSVCYSDFLLLVNAPIKGKMDKSILVT